jgi:hypothetical protein
MKKKRDQSFDVSGSDVDERGRLVNKDVPDEARRGAKKSKKSSNKRSEKLATLAEEEDAPKKRKRKRSVEAEVKPATSKALAKMEKRKRIVEGELIDLRVAKGDQYDAQYSSMFDNLRNITRTFELRMRDEPSSRDVYALSTLYSQMREVIADIRSGKDVEEQIHNLESMAYASFLKLVGQTYVDLFFKLQKEIRSTVKDPDVQAQLMHTLQGVCKDQGDKVQAGYTAMLDRVRTVLM